MNIPEEQITHSANCVELTGVQQLEARDTYNILGEIGEKTIVQGGGKIASTSMIRL